MDGEMLAAVIRWSGVVVALAGAVLTSPDGTKRLTMDFWRLLRRLLGRERRDVNVDIPTGIISVFGGEVQVKSDLMWGDQTPLEVRIQILLGHIEQVKKELSVAKKELSDRLDDHNEKIADLSSTLQRAERSLQKQINLNEDKAARIDAIGLPVIGLGIFLSGVPDDLASVPWLGIPLTYFSLYVTYIVALLGITRGAWSDKLS